MCRAHRCCWGSPLTGGWSGTVSRGCGPGGGATRAEVVLELDQDGLLPPPASKLPETQASVVPGRAGVRVEAVELILAAGRGALLASVPLVSTS